MFCLVTFTCALWLAGLHGFDSDDHPSHRLRTADPVIRTAIDEGRRGSPTFASLVDLIERSDMIVHVTRAYTLPQGIDGCLVPNRTQSQHLRVLIAMGLGKARTIMMIAHELQHVREVLDGGGGNDEAAIEALFTRIGKLRRGTSSERYETAAAQEVMTIVGREIQESR